MEKRPESLRQTVKQHPYAATFYALIALILFIYFAYSSGWDWTGFNSGTSQITIISTSRGNYTATISQPSKALWDWLQLLGVLAVPVVVGLGAAWFTAQQGKVSDRENKDNQREAALQAYIDKISELLLKEHLGELTADSKLKPERGQVRKIARTRTTIVLNQLDARRKREQVQKIARVRTITVLNQLDPRRAGYVFAFLREAGLQSDQSDRNIISFSNANLSKINLSEITLPEANLSEANLSYANLSGADLRKANLSGANLSGADLSKADLSEANLSGAILAEANLTEVVLRKADLSKATLEKANFSYADLAQSNLGEARSRSANFWRANFAYADLSNAIFSGANCSEANFGGTKLNNTSLYKANLSEAFFLAGRHRKYRNGLVGWGALPQDKPADLSGANLSEAILSGASIRQEQWEKAEILEGATLPDGSQLPQGSYIPSMDEFVS
jgi:uncharacterized protein YjbI with pentapeptide repeats